MCAVLWLGQLTKLQNEDEAAEVNHEQTKYNDAEAGVRERIASE